jgi:hypothetical protein
MVRAMARLAVVLLAAACCGTTGPAPAGGPSQPAPVIVSPAPATSTGSPTAPPPPPASPLALEACGEISHYQDGNAGPVLCPDGRPSQTADAYYRSLLPALAVLRVGADANLDDVETAMCADKTFAHLTNPMEESAYRLAAAEQGWGFGDEPVAWLIRQAC